ncbi:P-type DNA transfer protein VirB5 [Marilutibacter maris]|nr:P-type DNA transfer protein VirB5 [Lysobacter maris]
MIKIVVVMVVLTVAGRSSMANAQIPVTDTASITTRAAEHAENLAKYVEQITQLKSQLEQLEQQTTALTGSRNLGEVFNNPQLRDYLPQDWQGVYDSVKNGGYEGLTGAAAGILRQNQVFDACASVKIAEQKRTCEASAAKSSQDMAFASGAYEAAQKRLDQIGQLMGQINQTTDPKAIAELQGRIASEQAMIANEQTKLQLYEMMADAQGRMLEQRQRELNARLNARRGYSPLPRVDL